MKCILLIICIVCFCSCINNEQNSELVLNEIQQPNNHIIKQYFRKNGKKVSEQEFLKYDTGLVADGNYIKYYTNELMMFKEFYKNGTKYSNSYYYSNDGKLNEIVHYLNDSCVGSSYIYNGDMKLFCYEYKYYNSFNGYFFKVNYDESGDIKAIEGKPIIFYDKLIDYNSSRVDLLYFVAVPPKIKIKFKYLKKFSINGHKDIEILDSVKLFSYNDSLDMYYFNIPVYLFNSFIGTVNLYDSISNKLLYTDTVNYSTGAN